MKLSAQQKIQWIIAEVAAAWDDVKFPNFTSETFDDVYEEFCESHEDSIQDAKSEVRCSGVETGLPCQGSRHYESDAVAVSTKDGSWVGFTYWHGGGKWGEPEAVEWISEAYDLNVKEEEKVVISREFTRV